MLEALLGLPLRERSLPWMLHGDLAVSRAAPETTAPVGSGRGRQAAAIAYYPEGSPGSARHSSWFSATAITECG